MTTGTRAPARDRDRPAAIDAGAAPPPRGEPTRGLLKGLAVLEALLTHGGEAGISEISRTIGIDKATVYRLVNTLCTAGYVSRIEASGRYRLTGRMARLSGQVTARSLMEVALPVMRALAKATNETAYIAVPNGAEAVFLDKIEGDQAIRVHTPNGTRIPLYCGSAAKALLAFAPQDIAVLVFARLVPMTPHTIIRPAALKKELAAIRSAGYAIGEQEWRTGVSGVGAPVRDTTGAVVAALAISGPSERLARIRLMKLAPIVVTAAQQLSSALGYGVDHATGTSNPAPGKARDPGALVDDARPPAL